MAAPAEPRTLMHGIIADVASRRWPLLLALVAVGAGALAALQYAGLGLTLSHYDAKAHLVVARRILDNLMPGWVQIGAVWLPLPHLVNALPVQIDVFYRTGAFAVGISVLSFGATVYFVASLILGATGSRLAAALGALAVLLNPNVLYLQATPMTEPLLMALTAAAAHLAAEALRSGSSASARCASLALAAACLTRYEAWPVSAALLSLTLVSLLRQGRTVRAAAAVAGRMAVGPVAAILAFFALSRATTGKWFVVSGFFVAENEAMHRPLRAAAAVWWGLHELTGYPLAVLGAAGLAALAVRGLRSPRLAPWVPAAALAAAAALPWYAFVSGHPFRVRYMIPLIPAVGVGLGIAVGLAGRAKPILAAAAIAALALGPRPMDPSSPMVLEAQWDRPNQIGRGLVAAHLRTHWDGGPILASMGSLAHFMQELSLDGFRIRDFLHEGNGELWESALAQPDPHVAWILVEEVAEGGDVIASRMRQRPRLLAGYDRVAEGGGVALYRRKPAG